MDRCPYCEGTGIKIDGDGRMKTYEDGSPVYCTKCALGVGLELNEVTELIAKHQQAIRKLETQPNTPVTRRLRRDSKDAIARLLAAERSLSIALGQMTARKVPTLATVGDVVKVPV